MQTELNLFVAGSGRIEEATPNATCLYPAAATAFLPRQAGGLGLPDLAAAAVANQAKAVWRAFAFTLHPWAELFLHEAAKARAATTAGPAPRTSLGRHAPHSP